MPATIPAIPPKCLLVILAENNGMESKVMNNTFVFLMASWYPGFGAREIALIFKRLTVNAKTAQISTMGKKDFKRILSAK